MSNDLVLAPGELLALELGVFRDVCRACDTPRALASWLLVKSGEFAQYLALSKPDSDPLQNPGFADDYLVTEMLRKNPRLSTGVNRVHAAKRSWVRSERRNRVTNHLIRTTSWTGDDFPARTVRRVRRMIARVLGPLDGNALESIVKKGRHGPGATSTVRGQNVTAANKMISSMGVTPDLWPMRHSLTYLWQDETVGFIPEHWDTWINVPKSALTDRGISINPGLNVFVQLGVGEYIRERLKAFGLDIRNGQSRHKWLVGLCERLGLSTIDLSAASDSICFELVKLLLPKRWFHLLEMLRTPYTRISGQTVHVAKFAAMGNGYTFELETLIFWALAVCVDELMVCDGDADVRKTRFVSAYGDDIIVPREIAPRLIEVLELLGFSTNVKKTFLAGSFFESCGTDCWRGEDVRPFYLDSDPRDKTEAVILIANGIRLYAARRGNGVGCDKRFLKSWLNIIARDHSARMTGLPVMRERRTSSDIERKTSVSAGSGLIRNFDEFVPRLYMDLPRCETAVREFNYTALPAGIDGYAGKMYYFPPVNYKPSKSNILHHVGCYIVGLHASLEEDGTTRTIETVRGGSKPGRLKSTLVPSWGDIGPWVDLQVRRAA